jgi:hypothetical protein
MRRAITERADDATARREQAEAQEGQAGRAESARGSPRSTGARARAHFSALPLEVDGHHDSPGRARAPWPLGEPGAHLGDRLRPAWRGRARRSGRSESGPAPARLGVGGDAALLVEDDHVREARLPAGAGAAPGRPPACRRRRARAGRAPPGLRAMARPRSRALVRSPSRQPHVGQGEEGTQSTTRAGSRRPTKRRKRPLRRPGAGAGRLFLRGARMLFSCGLVARFAGAGPPPRRVQGGL